MEARLYLGLNSLLYLIFGIWCAVAPQWTAEAVGLAFPGPQGFTEYVAVYGGLEFGLGVFLLLCTLRPTLNFAGILFCLCMYCGLFVFRTTAITHTGLAIGNAFNFYVTECLLAAWSIRLYLKLRAH